jgi:hypothetical protein
LETLLAQLPSKAGLGRGELLPEGREIFSIVPASVAGQKESLCRWWTWNIPQETPVVQHDMEGVCMGIPLLVLQIIVFFTFILSLFQDISFLYSKGFGSA